MEKYPTIQRSKAVKYVATWMNIKIQVVSEEAKMQEDT